MRRAGEGGTWDLMAGFKARMAEPDARSGRIAERESDRASKDWRRGWLIADRMRKRLTALPPKRRGSRRAVT